MGETGQSWGQMAQRPEGRYETKDSQEKKLVPSYTIFPFIPGHFSLRSPIIPYIYQEAMGRKETLTTPKS